MEPKIHHIQITVQNFEKAEKFYDQLMPILGFDLSKKSKGYVKEHEFEVIEYVHPVLTLGINSPRTIFKNESVHRRKPGSLHHLAFRANSCAEVDELFEKIKKTDAEIVYTPQFFPQHGAFYYAAFIKDLDGIKYEIVYEK